MSSPASRWTQEPFGVLTNFEFELGPIGYLRTHALSGLVGAIWRASELLSFDAAFRAAAVAGSPIYEARLGLTWAVTVMRSP